MQGVPMSQDFVNFLKTTNARITAMKEVFVLRGIAIVIMGLVVMNAR